MKNYFLVLLLTRVCQVTHSISISEYTKLVLNNADREYQPLSASLCEKYYYLTSCDMFKHDPITLARLSQKYLNPTTNYWPRLTRADVVQDVDAYYTQIYSYDNPYYVPHEHYESQQYFRGKRSVADSEPAGDESEDKLNRTKRNVNGNPCIQGNEKKTIIFYSVDAENGNPVELLQGVVGSIYQYFYTRECVLETFDQYNCEVAYVTHTAAVFNDWGGVSIRPVKIASSCSMRIM